MTTFRHSRRLATALALLAVAISIPAPATAAFAPAEASTAFGPSAAAALPAATGAALPAATSAALRAATGAAPAIGAVTPAAFPAGAAAASMAAADTKWAVQPSTDRGPDGRDYFIYANAPGSERTDHVGIRNLTGTPLTFAVYGTDAHTTADGAFALLPAAQSPADVGSWVTLASRTYTVPANTRLDVPFRLTVPANATPGDHAGGLVASIAESATDANGQTVLVDRRIAVRIYLTVDGPARPEMTIDGLRVSHTQGLSPASGGTTTVTYRLRNTGNLRLTGASTVRVTGPAGWRLASTDALAVPQLLPGSEISITEQITGVQPAGRLTATVSVVPSTPDTLLGPVTLGTSLWAPPWVLIGLLGLLPAWVSYRLIRVLRARRRAVRPPRTSPRPSRPRRRDRGVPQIAGTTCGTPRINSRPCRSGARRPGSRRGRTRPPSACSPRRWRRARAAHPARPAAACPRRAGRRSARGRAPPGPRRCTR
ncbi:hypothetical protein J2S43_003617 [Catenuloplanes nepalensis]|uniref:DUF916 domain-containing protein n=1 Tax=Catenuloplanes nepalensis TaxID=587533 RepID=A0ABT9MUN2_9ACTN|nr:hypothetical protein [Catenuloplanes nepalensis]